MQFSNTKKVAGSGSVMSYGYLTYYTNIGLVGYWDMETIAPDGKLVDLSINKDNGIGVGGVVIGGVSGKIRKATIFNGTGTYITVGYNTARSFSDNFTLSAWIYPTSYHTIGYYGLKNEFLSCGPAGTYNYALQATDSGTISFIKRTGVEILQYYNFTGIPSLTNKWTHITATILNNNISLYIDGVLFGSQPVGIIGPGTHDFLSIGGIIGGTVGGISYAPEPLFQGSLDEIRIYKRALSSKEIQALYSAIKP